MNNQDFLSVFNISIFTKFPVDLLYMIIEYCKIEICLFVDISWVELWKRRSESIFFHQFVDIMKKYFVFFNIKHQMQQDKKAKSVITDDIWYEPIFSLFIDKKKSMEFSFHSGILPDVPPYAHTYRHSTTIFYEILLWIPQKFKSQFERKFLDSSKKNLKTRKIMKCYFISKHENVKRKKFTEVIESFIQGGMMKNS